MYKLIDCHTHIINSDIAREYFDHGENYALVMQFPESIYHNPDTVKTVQDSSKLFLCPVIDIKKSPREIKETLSEIGKQLEEQKVVGLKIYLTYQRGKANDEKLIPVYEFASANDLAVTFHTGSCSLVLPTDNDIEGSSAVYIAEMADRFPKVNFVAAHLGDPDYYNCMRIVSEHSNMFSDYSGLFEPGYEADDDFEGSVALYKDVIRTFPEGYKHILYGTDFCPPINLYKREEYDRMLEGIFLPEERAAVCYENALRAFPRLRLYIK